MEEKKKGIGLIGLIGMVISSCIGSGVFAITGQLAGDGEHARADARADHHTDEPNEPNAFLFLFHTSIPSLAGLVPTSALCARCPQIRATPWRRGPALETTLSLNEPPGENERPVVPRWRHPDRANDP